MIASIRGLVVLAVIAIALALIALAGRPPHVPVDRALVPGLDVDRITELRVGDVQLVRDAIGWRWVAPPGRADPAAIDAVISALRGARWHRRAARGVVGNPRTTLTIDRTTTLAVGNSLGDQTWIGRADDAVLVDGWVAAALAPEPLALRVRHPFGDAAGAHAIRFVGPRLAVTLEGRPRRLVAPVVLRLATAPARSVDDALAELEIVAIGRDFVASPPVAIQLDGVESVAVGTCAGAGELVYLRTPLGDGCVDPGRWQAVVAAFDALGGPAAAIVERRPLPIDPVTLVLPDGSVARDPDRTLELVAALGAPAEVVALPSGKPTGSIVATARDGTQLQLDLYDHVLARHGEPVALRPTDWATIARPAAAYRDETRWLEEPATISSITVDGAGFRRGAVLGEWSAHSALVDALAATLASVRAPAAPGVARIEHRVEVTFTPPAGAPTMHRLELGPLGPEGCPGRVDGQPAMLPLALCAAAIAVAAAR